MNIKTLSLRAVILGLPMMLGGSFVFAQQTGYSQTNLVANTAGVANHTDPQLSNPWGISFIPGQPFWVANNNGGTSTLYDAEGIKTQPTVVIPVASHNPCPKGCNHWDRSQQSGRDLRRWSVPIRYRGRHHSQLDGSRKCFCRRRQFLIGRCLQRSRNRYQH
jgi:hypothetical protein